MSLTALVYLILFSVSNISALLFSPVYGIYFYIANLFLFPFNKWWYSDIPHIQYIFINSLIILIAFILHISKYKEVKVFQFTTTKFFLGLIIVSFLVLPLALVPSQHMHYSILLVKYFALYFILIKTVDNNKKLDILLLVFIISCFYWGWLAYLDPARLSGRLESFGGPGFSDANEAAAVILTTFPLMLYFIMKGDKLFRYPALIALPFILNIFILYNSRGAFLAFICMYIYILIQLFVHSKPTNINKSYLFVSFLAFLALFIYLTDNTFINRMQTIIDSSQHGRIEIWKGAWSCTLDHPLGVGRRGFAALSPQYLSSGLLDSKTGMRAAHSIIFETLTTLGLLGLIILSLFFLSIIKASLTSKKAYIGRGDAAHLLRTVLLESSLFGYLIASLFLSNMYSEFIYIFSALILINQNLSALSQIQAEPYEAEPEPWIHKQQIADYTTNTSVLH